MKPQQAPAGMRCHLVRTDGEIVGDGDAVAYAQPHQTVEWYASYAERETLPEVDAWRRVMVSIDKEAGASSSSRDWNLTLEYANKRIEAQLWLADHPVEDNATIPAAPSLYEHLRAEVEVMGITPFEAASAIMGAVYESAQSTRRRVESREQARAMRPATP
jgi:hypothetical protein